MILARIGIAVSTVAAIAAWVFVERWIKHGSILCAFGLHWRQFAQDRGLYCDRCNCFIERWVIRELAAQPAKEPHA